ncbi:MAG TPA: hypothetical protein VGO93_19310 [Candidatus Xenobia bacterium]|jgi:hypothetical protein
MQFGAFVPQGWRLDLTSASPGEAKDFRGRPVTLDGVVHKNEVLDRHCEDLGQDPGWVRRSLSLEVMYGDPRIDYFIAYFPDAAFGDSLERFAAEVMPALRPVAVAR